MARDMAKVDEAPAPRTTYGSSWTQQAILLLLSARPGRQLFTWPGVIGLTGLAGRADRVELGEHFGGQDEAGGGDVLPEVGHRGRPGDRRAAGRCARRRAGPLAPGVHDDRAGRVVDLRAAARADAHRGPTTATRTSTPGAAPSSCGPRNGSPCPALDSAAARA